MEITLSIYGLIAFILVSGGLAHLVLSALISARGSQEESSDILIQKVEHENQHLRAKVSELENEITALTNQAKVQKG